MTLQSTCRDEESLTLHFGRATFVFSLLKALSLPFTPLLSCSSSWMIIRQSNFLASLLSRSIYVCVLVGGTNNWWQGMCACTKFVLKKKGLEIMFFSEMKAEYVISKVGFASILGKPFYLHFFCDCLQPFWLLPILIHQTKSDISQD